MNIFCREKFLNLSYEEINYQKYSNKKSILRSQFLLIYLYKLYESRMENISFKKSIAPYDAYKISK